MGLCNLIMIRFGQPFANTADVTRLSESSFQEYMDENFQEAIECGLSKLNLKSLKEGLGNTVEVYLFVQCVFVCSRLGVRVQLRSLRAGCIRNC